MLWSVLELNTCKSKQSKILWRGSGVKSHVLQAKRNTLKGSAALNIIQGCWESYSRNLFQIACFWRLLLQLQTLFSSEKKLQPTSLSILCRKIGAVKIQTLRPMKFVFTNRIFSDSVVFCNVFVEEVMMWNVACLLCECMC